MRMRAGLILGILLLCANVVQSQLTNPDSASFPQIQVSSPFSTSSPKFTARGYVKNLQSLTVIPSDVMDQLGPLRETVDSFQLSNLIHHRLNLRWYPSDRVSLGLEQRSRIFAGDNVTANPLFVDQLEADPGSVDASWVLWDSDHAAIHTRVERLWLQYAADTWEVRVGRQRINWGMHLVWNPNDLFNAFAFLDFDYEEMPGADAIRVSLFPGFQTIELAYAPDFRGMNRHVAAARYGFNAATYDIQFLAGWRHEESVFGAGWAGNLGNASFKGEIAWFHPVLDSAPEKEGLSAAVSIDHTFEKPVYVHGAYLYSNRGSNDALNPTDFLEFNPVNVPSPDRPMLSQHSLLGQAVWTATPLLNLSGTVIYGPGPDMLIVFPGLGYSIADNWDLLLNAQFFWVDASVDPDGLLHLTDAVFFRVKWSY